MPGVEIFPRTDGSARRCADLRHSLDILGWRRIFQPEQREWFEGLGQANGIGDVVGPVAVQRQFDIGAEHFPDRPHDVDHPPDRSVGQRAIIGVELEFWGERVEIEFDRIKATLSHL